MSSSHYKNELSKALLKLHDAQTAAAEWKQVAINRKTLLSAIDGAVTAQVYYAIKVGTVLGVTAHDPELPTVDPSSHSAGEATSIVLRKLAFSSSFLAGLCKEANQLQSTLLSVLNIALESKDVERPLHDVEEEDVHRLVAEAASPFMDENSHDLWRDQMEDEEDHQEALPEDQYKDQNQPNNLEQNLGLVTTSEAQRRSALDLFE